MKKLKSLWMWFNGNKTIIALTITGLIQTSFVKNHVGVDAYELMTWAGTVLSAVAGLHHFSKGYFSTKVGNPGQFIPRKKSIVEK